MKLKVGEWTFVYAQSNYDEAEALVGNEEKEGIFEKAQMGLGIELS
jgi:hypothetical protein